MNQIILIGDAKTFTISKSKDLTLVISTKDYDKKELEVKVKVEKGYPTEMVKVLKTRPLVAVKCELIETKNGVGFVASKMSVLKLTSDSNE